MSADLKIGTRYRSIQVGPVLIAGSLVEEGKEGQEQREGGDMTE